MLRTLPRSLRTAGDAAEVARRMHDRLARHGLELPVRLWDGSTLGPDQMPYRLVLPHPWSVRQLLPASDLTAGDVYVSGYLDIEGSLIDALHHLHGVRSATDGGIPPRTRVAMTRDLWSLPAPPSSNDDGDATAIRHHDDGGNDFYPLILDYGLVYSCAIFDADDAAAPAEDRSALTRAQVRKLDTVCRKLHLQPGERFLDIGCGWGALALHAARHYGVEAVGITRSPAQAELARESVEAAGLAERIEIRVADYREVTETFDGIASLGMGEHGGHQALGAYVEVLVRALRPGGRLLSQGITTGRPIEVRDLSQAKATFVGANVFPGGALIPVEEMVRVLHAAGLETRDVEQLRPHYALTLRHWVANLEAAWDEAVAEVGERTARMWRACMSGSVIDFETGALGVVQILAVTPDARLPLGRDWMRPTRP